MKQFWKFVQNEAKESELILEGVIASESWYEDEISPKQFREALDKHTGNITVRINSPGGDVFAGMSIMNMLKDRDGEVTIIVDGLAASIASVIAMAGDKVIMNTGSMMMIHNAWSFAVGDSQELRKLADQLDKIGESIVSVYATRTGLDADTLKSMLDAETWMTADEAVEMGFADEAVEGKTKLSEMVQNVLKLTQDVNNAVAQPAMSLKTKLKNEQEVEETDVPNTTETVDEDASEASAPADGEQEQADKTETEEIVETTVEENNQSTERTEMAETTELAKASIVTPENQATVTPKASMKDYLKSDEAMETFAQILQANPGDMGGGSSAKVRNAWKEHLEVKAGVTNPEIFLPTPLITAIQNAFEDGGEIWNRVAKVGVDVWNAAWDTENDVNDNNGRARGYNRADAEEKAEQVLTFDDRVLRPQFVYKYITLNKEDIKEQRSSGALVTYILSELPQRIVREVERAIVLGDGRAADNDYKIKEGDPRGFYPIVADAEAEGYFGDVVEIGVNQSLAEVVARAKDEIKTPGEIILIAKKGFSTDARFEKDTEGRLLFPLGSRAQDVFDVDTVIEPDWFTDTNSPDIDAVVVVLSAYKVVGDTSIEGFQNFILKTNKQEYLQEIWAGGGLTGRKSAVAIAVAGS
jgi:ATP-dependent Clp protease protease subunit